MKNIIFLIAIISIMTIGCAKKITKVAESTATTTPVKKEPIARQYIKWDSEFVEYGKVKKGEKRQHTYKFQNVSKEDVEIKMCTACDCTSMEWTTSVVKPGAFGEINTTFNSAEKNESETISITIILRNTDPVMQRPIIDNVKFHFDIEK
jgi:Protein of unknown function (DUF1573)